MNSAITGFTFFGIREFAVSPILTRLAPWAQYVERRKSLGIETPSGDTLTEEPVEPPSLRMKNLLDSGISGAITGGILRGVRSGRPAVGPGALLGTAVCTSGQYIFNEFNLARLRFIARRNEEKVAERATTREPTFNPRTGKQEVQELPRSWTEMILVMFGLVPLSDDEYLGKLKRTRDVYLKKISQLEVAVAMEEEEKRLKEELSRS
ncbi:hypothetical protein D9619_005323 [Psilocybe cf. subviscida]|uniref:Uncharacterized protein n=1 Tax=Psilocybe cf. subviscida TaxID=2480587 RepID=A0A8H5BWA7_9AGAR|nr:hypothetical protein D9619_005323 [Psilocybe cf. subviscida]